MHAQVKFYLLFSIGLFVYLPFIYMSAFAQFYVGIGAFSVCFLFYIYLIYTAVYLKHKRKYPMVPPEGRADIYFPRTNIPRPIYEDVRRFPKSFRKKKQKRKN